MAMAILVKVKCHHPKCFEQAENRTTTKQTEHGNEPNVKHFVNDFCVFG